MDEALRQMKDLAKNSLAPTDGIVTAKGLKQEVRILRDRWGVPHIFASNSDDLFFALGYTHAQERLWQMEFNRRLAAGTLSEMLGEVTLDIDVFMRTVGLRRTAEAAARLMQKEGDDFTVGINTAYVEGINEFIKGRADTLPFEFAALSWQPCDWTLSDVFVCSLLVLWQLSMNWGIEILRGDVVERLGEKRARELFPSYPSEASLVVASQRQSSDIAAYLLNLQKKVVGRTGPDSASAGSNNWVIDGSKSTTGMPILANDPHLPLGTPSIWYEAHLVAPGFNVIGVTLPGTTGVVIGHNERVAWGFTNLYADVQDMYVEQFNPDNRHQYLFEGKWEEAESCLEEFHVRGSAQPVTREVLITRHGPIMDSVMVGLAKPEIKRWPRQALALRWTGHDPHNIVLLAQGFMKLNRARNWEEFREALRMVLCLSQNIVYADVDGNIGYQATGLVPIRAKGQGLVPVPGWTGEYEWQGYIPFEELPSAFNPPTHFLATANNKIVHEDYPYLITHDWETPHRVRRIVQLLTDKDKLSTEDFMKMQADVYSLWAKDLVPFLARLKAQNDRQGRALEHIRAWDLRMDKDSVAATILHVWYMKLARNILIEKLGPDLYEHYFMKQLGLSEHHFLAILQVLEYHDSYWLGSGPVSNLEKRDKLVQLSLEQALEELTETLGSDMSTWRWGRLHTATFRHRLGIAPPLDQVLNAGPVEVGGDWSTINRGIFDYSGGFGTLAIASYRQIVDLGNLSNSVAMHSPGQSGQPASDHYRDFVEPWAEVRYHPMLFDRAAIEKQAKELLKLIPT